MPEAAPTHIEAGLYYSSAENNIPGGKVKESMGSGGVGRAGEHDGLVIAVALGMAGLTMRCAACP